MYLLKDLLKEFVFDMQIRNLSKRTIKTANNSLNAFFTYAENDFKVTALDELNSLHIKKYMGHLSNLGRTEVYINSILKYLRMFYKYCIKEEYITERENPVLKVNWMKEPQIIINTFTDDEAIRMLKQWDYKTFYNARNKAIIALLFETGIRNLELCSLNLSDVKERIILVRGKGNKERHVPISPALKKILIKYERMRMDYVKRYNSPQAYFLSYRGKRLTIESIQRVVKQTGEKANVREEIRCSPHTIRHYYAQFMLKNQTDTFTISRLLGHNTTLITRRYLQSIRDAELVEMVIDTSPLTKFK